MATRHAPHILILHATEQRCEPVRERLAQRGLSSDCFDLRVGGEDPSPKSADVAAFVLSDDTTPEHVARVQALLDQLSNLHVASLVWGLPAGTALTGGNFVDRASPEVTPDEVVGRLSVLAQLSPTLRRMELEINQMQRLGAQVNRYFEEIDKEMRLAGRLQREFLPSTLPSRPKLRFAALYRPAAWVSGDIYDVFAINERRLGVFVGDAMGHGTAAALMSMFLRTALTVIDTTQGEPRVLPPEEALAGVHRSLCRQNLRRTQFVTAAYITIDPETLEASVARGGHPYPILARSDGTLDEIRPEGGLIGVADLEPEFAHQSLALHPGDKVIVYTDGLEDVIVTERTGRDTAAQFTEHLFAWKDLGADEFIAAMNEFLDRRSGSLNPEDDMTVVVAEAIR